MVVYSADDLADEMAAMWADLWGMGNMQKIPKEQNIGIDKQYSMCSPAQGRRSWEDKMCTPMRHLSSIDQTDKTEDTRT